MPRSTQAAANKLRRLIREHRIQLDELILQGPTYDPGDVLRKMYVALQQTPDHRRSQAQREMSIRRRASPRAKAVIL